MPRFRKNSPEPDPLPHYPASDAPLDAALIDWLRTGAPAGGFSQTISQCRSWEEPAATVDLRAHYYFSGGRDTPVVHANLDGHYLALDEPIALAPVAVPKPWGRELWYTGIEARGESSVVTPAGELPLSKYLALAPRRLCEAQPVVLLKVLDPRPEPVLGDLYFEVHENKREVYVVTRVDPGAWPDGVGEIRFGMDQAVRAAYADDAAFRAAYREAVASYERIRRAIDDGTAGADAAAEEASGREAMERFTARRPLSVGDVVVVPTWVPHSLQHGVRVVEFQTPDYDRYIVSFAQKVLTQDHWDTERAVAGMNLDTPEPPQLVEVAPGVTRIVQFEDFSAWRIELAPESTCPLPVQRPYAVCMGVLGEARLGPLTLGPEQAAFVPASALPLEVGNPGGEPAVVLVAAPPT